MYWPGHEYEYGRGLILWLLCWFGRSTNTNTAGALFVDCLGWLSCVQPGQEYEYGHGLIVDCCVDFLCSLLCVQPGHEYEYGLISWWFWLFCVRLRLQHQCECGHVTNTNTDTNISTAATAWFDCCVIPRRHDLIVVWFPCSYHHQSPVPILLYNGLIVVSLIFRCNWWWADIGCIVEV